MVFEFVSGIGEKATKAYSDVKGNFSRFDRFIVTRNVNARTVITDTAKGKRIIDTEDCYTREFSLFKLIISTLVIFVSLAAFLVALKGSASQKKKAKLQKKELKRLKKLCRKADIEIPEDN